MARPRNIRTATTAATACAALVVAAGAALLPSERTAGAEHPTLLASGERGKIRIANSKRGDPVLTAVGLRPGSIARGSLKITNVGEARTRLSLSMLGLRDSPGPAGLPLTPALELRVVRRHVRYPVPHQTPPGRKRLILYEGPLAGMPPLRLGRWGPEAHRRFRFRAELPDGGVPSGPSAGDNAYQGASARVRFVWGAQRLP